MMTVSVRRMSWLCVDLIPQGCLLQPHARPWHEKQIGWEWDGAEGGFIQLLDHLLTPSV